MKDFLVRGLRQTYWLGLILCGAMLLAGAGWLAGYLGDDRDTGRTVALIVAIAGPMFVGFIFAGFSSRPLAVVVQVTLAVAATVVIGLSYLRLGYYLEIEGVWVVEKTMWTVIAFFVATSIACSVVRSDKSNKPFWVGRQVEYGKAFLSVGLVASVGGLLPKWYELLFDKNLGGMIDQVFGQVVGHYTIMAFMVIGFVGGATLLSLVIARGFYRPWFEIARGEKESAVAYTAVKVMEFLATTLVAVFAMWVMTTTGFTLLVAQMGSDELPFAIALIASVDAITVTWAIAEVKFNNNQYSE